MGSDSYAAQLFLGLSQVHGIGFKVLQELGGVLGVQARQEAFELWPQLCSLLGRTEEDLRLEVEEKGEAMSETFLARDIHLVSEQDPEFPSAFERLPDGIRPLWFFARGDLQLLQTPAIAVVGTREPTETGAFLARYAVSTAAELHLPVVSGLAKGIDGIAHEWAILSGTPNISVLATGILRTYPARHSDLADKIVDQGGVLVSEYLPDASPSADSFVWRNRLQAALAACVIAPEWKRASGTAHTIKFATAFGRPTVNLIAQGVEQPADHGQASLTFTVPRDHLPLRRALVAAWTEALEQPKKQAELFG